MASRRRGRQPQHHTAASKRGGSGSGSGSGSVGPLQQPRRETRRLVLAAVGDCARANADPGARFWAALRQWLHPVPALPTGELSALALALATLDVPSPAQPLWEEVVAAAAHAVGKGKGVGPQEASQLRKALTLLLGPGGGFRVGPQPTLAWLLPLLRAREGRQTVVVGGGQEEDEQGEAAAAAAAATAAAVVGSSNEARPLLLKRKREQGRARRAVVAPASSQPPATTTAAAAATTYSALHRRLLDLLSGMGCAAEAEVAYQGLNLDIILQPPPGSSLKPLVVEVDGPQHFLQGDPARPTGPTAARRRLLRAATDAFAGLVSVTYADEDRAAEEGAWAGEAWAATPRGRLLALLEHGAQAQAGVALAVYRIGDSGGGGAGGRESEGQWALARRFLVAPTPEALLEEVRACEANARAMMDAAAWAVAVGRMAGFLRHGHRFHGRSPSARAARRRWLVDGGGAGVLRSEAQAVALVAAAPFPALAALMGALVDFYDGAADAKDRAVAAAQAAAARIDALLSSSETAEAAATAMPPVLVALLQALASLGYRLEPSLQQQLLPLLARRAQEGRFDTHGLASLVHSLGRLLPDSSGQEAASAARSSTSTSSTSSTSSSSSSSSSRGTGVPRRALRRRGVSPARGPPDGPRPPRPRPRGAAEARRAAFDPPGVLRRGLGGGRGAGGAVPAFGPRPRPPDAQGSWRRGRGGGQRRQRRRRRQQWR